MANTAELAELERLTKEVAETEEVVDALQDRYDCLSAVVLIKGLAQQIRDLKDDPAELTALADRLDSKAKALGDAVAENTPAEEEPEEEAELL